MARDPLAAVVDAPLFIVPRVLDRLRSCAGLPGWASLPARTAAELDALLARLLAGIERHPTKFWVMTQFQKTLEAIDGEDAALQAQVRTELERLMQILGIGSSDGVLGFLPSAVVALPQDNRN